MAHQAWAYPGFCGIKRLGVCLLPLGWDARVTPSIKFAGTHLYIWVERGTVRVKCLAQDHNTMSPARAPTQTACTGVECTNHEAAVTEPPITDIEMGSWGGWRSGESARLPPMCPGFDSRTRRDMLVEFVVCSRPSSEGFSPGSPVFLPPQKSTFLNSNSIGNSRATGLSVEDCYVLPSLNKVNLFIYLFIYLFI